MKNVAGTQARIVNQTMATAWEYKSKMMKRRRTKE
jgi:hypothetical protein